METKVNKVKRLVAEGEYKKALQICKDWDYVDPMHRDILRTGYECLMYPHFYIQLGKDPGYQYEEAVKVLHKIYGN